MKIYSKIVAALIVIQCLVMWRAPLYGIMALRDNPFSGSSLMMFSFGFFPYAFALMGAICIIINKRIGKYLVLVASFSVGFCLMPFIGSLFPQFVKPNLKWIFIFGLNIIVGISLMITKRKVVT